MGSSTIGFIDFEIDRRGKILDIGAVKSGYSFHSSQIQKFLEFIADCAFLCGHNIVEHDIKYLQPFLNKELILIDTLYLSPLLFPKSPYHRLLKDEKLLSDELNNPLNDAIKAQQLYNDEVEAFRALPKNLQGIYYDLTKDDIHFKGFYKSIGYVPQRRLLFRTSTEDKIRECLNAHICKNADIANDINTNGPAAAYAIAIIMAADKNSITPAWVLKNYPGCERMLWKWRNKRCSDPNCTYCSTTLNAEAALKRWFRYEKFRLFGGEALQENAVKAAINGDSLLAIFPTGGGKSLTFQLPALIAGESAKGLTIVISPLQSLMKDQVENLERKGITDAVYINGLLTPVERRDAIERVFNGKATLLYMAPEQLRSKTIEKALTCRSIARIVIDEAHCFSAWGQDFRIEYMYIADFIRRLMEIKGLQKPIPVSCFTATAKPKVISDIADYFQDNLGITLKRFTTDETRANLHYTVLYRTNNEDKYQTLRELLAENPSPSIVYVTRTKTAENIADKLRKDGFSAKAFHGQMDSRVKIETQNEFMSNKTRTIVATSAFGMGVDKSDIGLVVHFEISDSLENYVQEAGRAGRDIHSEASCYVLYNDDDLNRHFALLNQTKLTMREINQVWRAIISLTAKHNVIHISALEIARKAGWDEIHNVESKVKSALGALETAGYIKRGMNSPRVFATSIVPKNMDEATECIEQCEDFKATDKTDARRIIKSLISERSRANAGSADAESRIDYLADILGIETRQVIRIVEMMRLNGILAKDDDMTAYLRPAQIRKLTLYTSLENKIISLLAEGENRFSLKQLNESAEEAGISGSSVKNIKTVLLFWIIKEYINKTALADDHVEITPTMPLSTLQEKIHAKNSAANFVLGRFRRHPVNENNEIKVTFSTAELTKSFKSCQLTDNDSIDLSTMEDALLFLSKTGIITLEGGFMVLYNKLELERLNKNNRSRYKKDDYKHLDEFYRQRIQQIHIIGKYANIMVADEHKALEYIHDYFALDVKSFIRKYFDEAEAADINRNISRKKYNEIFGTLTGSQEDIIKDRNSKYIVVPACPGSGKTYVLVRKLASLILMEDIKSEQLLMLTFSRAAAIEFKKRLKALVGNAANFVEIKTFHSYCFDLLGKLGSIEKSQHIVRDAVDEISSGNVEKSLITKSILVIDEAQDMSKDEFDLVKALIKANEEMRVIAVGDDDQNIYEFRGSDSSHMASMIHDYQATIYEMTDNFRSSKAVIGFANQFAGSIQNRLKSSTINGVRTDAGMVRLHGHHSANYEQAIVNELKSLRHSDGTYAVLTYTNDDALILSALLKHEGINARLVQSREDFRLADMAELRHFIDTITASGQSSLNAEEWCAAKTELQERFSDSNSLITAMNCIEAFEIDCPKRKFISDFNDYLLESNLESFIDQTRKNVIVSTIHKSKGCEYDNVFISLKGLNQITEQEKRAIYVGMTRARNNLSIHLDNPLVFSGCRFDWDNTDYGAPKEILLQLSHRDVVLEFFKYRQNDIIRLHSGSALKVDGDYLTTEHRVKVVKFSTAMRKRLTDLEGKGYSISSAGVRFQVFWKDRNEDNGVQELLILLPDIYLSRSGC